MMMMTRRLEDRNLSLQTACCSRSRVGPLLAVLLPAAAAGPWVAGEPLGSQRTSPSSTSDRAGASCGPAAGLLLLLLLWSL